MPTFEFFDSYPLDQICITRKAYLSRGLDGVSLSSFATSLGNGNAYCAFSIDEQIWPAQGLLSHGFPFLRSPFPAVMLPPALISHPLDSWALPYRTITCLTHHSRLGALRSCFSVPSTYSTPFDDLPSGKFSVLLT
ncbi:hypothetical protein LshimejAT787_0603390 [Lyophyllum shimeji]|uniref:Uncharacterized protein n=1 Tax=Lyophyllum shimeji TaxID=47721 RepID=A0A9P3UNC2_LYOSH|nr:hypothetical protein LshimejAT787_0603390 [Lyophyllum shimeji]